MAITVGFNAGSAGAAAAQFAQQLQGLNTTVQSLSQAVSKFDSSGKLVSQTFKGMTADGQRVELVLKQTATGFELISAKVDKAAASLKAFQTASNNATPPGGGRSSESSLITGAGVARLVEAQVIKRVTGAIQSALFESIPVAQEFSIKIAEIGTISQQSGVSMEQFAAGIRQLSSQFGATQADVAEGAYQALSNQVTKGADTFQFLNTALRFGKAAVASTADSVNLLSGAMRSFNIPASEAERVASVLFKTIELGRVRAKEMADTFGRIGTVAADVGVTLEETGAAIAVLTNRGVKFNDASTLIQNVLLKLLRPTEEMTKFLDDLGFSSGEAAVKALGFGGVLQKLDVEAQKGTSRLGELFNQVRALRGVIGLTGGAFQDFNSALEQVKNGTNDFNNAVKIVEASFGDRLKVQLNEAKVAFTEVVGDTVLQQLVKAGEGVGGLGNAIKTVTPVIFAGGAAILAYKVGTISITAATALWTTATAANTAVQAQDMFVINSKTGAVTRLTGATQGATAATSAFAAVVGSFAAGAAVGYILFFEDARKRAEELRASFEKLAGVRFDQLKNINIQITTNREGFNEVQQNLDFISKGILQRQAEIVKGANAARDAATQNLKVITEQVKASSTAFFTAAEQRLGDLKRTISAAREEIKRSLQITEELPRKLGQQIFDLRSKFANEGRIDLTSGAVVDDQKSQLIRQRINELTELARRKSQEGSEESLADARKLYDDITKLETEFGELQIKNQRRAFDESVRRGTATPTATEIDPVTGQLKQRFEFLVNTQQIEQRLKAIADERLAVEKRIREEKEAQIKAAEKTVQAEKAKLDALKSALEAASKIKLLDEQGKLKPEFAGTSTVDGRQTANLDKAVAEFERQQKRARDNAKTSSLADAAALEAILLQQSQAFYAQVAAIRAAEEEKSKQQTIARDVEAIQARIKAYAQANEKIAADLTAALKKGFVDASVASANDRTRSDQVDEAIRKTLDKLVSGVPDASKIKAAEPFIEKAKQIAAEYTKAGEAVRNSASPENVANFKRVAEALSQALREAASARTGSPFDALPRGNAAVEAIRGIADSVKAVEDAGRRIAENTRDLIAASDATKRLGAEFDRLNPGVLLRIATEAQNAATPFNAAVDTMEKKVDDLLRKINSAASALGNLGRQQVPVGPPAPGPDENRFGGRPKYFEAGGFAGPRGSDNILAYLNKDEFVANKGATDNWAPLLQAMNAGLTPSSLNNNNVTNVGDINVNVSGGNTSQQSLKNIATGLRRGIRRKTISLS